MSHSYGTKCLFHESYDKAGKEATSNMTDFTPDDFEHIWGVVGDSVLQTFSVNRCKNLPFV